MSLGDDGDGDVADASREHFDSRREEEGVGDGSAFRLREEVEVFHFEGVQVEAFYVVGLEGNGVDEFAGRFAGEESVDEFREGRVVGAHGEEVFAGVLVIVLVGDVAYAVAGGEGFVILIEILFVERHLRVRCRVVLGVRVLGPVGGVSDVFLHDVIFYDLFFYLEERGRMFVPFAWEGIEKAPSPPKDL